MSDLDPTTRPARMVDVGRLAGVSAQTVSRYYTGKGYVGAETRERIQAAIDELDYRLNQSARNLRVNSTRTIGVLMTGPSLYGTWAILEGMNLAARDHGFGLLTTQLGVAPSDVDAQAAVHDALERFLVARVDGIVVSSPYLGIEELLARGWETIPIVILSGRPTHKMDSATVDSYEAGVLATTHLVELGHSRILHIAGPANRNESHERERGYLDVISKAGLTPLPVVRGDWSAQSGEAVGLEADPGAFTAVFSGNDQMALGFMSALRTRGLKPPADYSIIGVDDMPDARYFPTPLSSISMDFAGLGHASIQMISKRIETGKRAARCVIHPKLVQRDSTTAINSTGSKSVLL